MIPQSPNMWRGGNVIGTAAYLARCLTHVKAAGGDDHADGICDRLLHLRRDGADGLPPAYAARAELSRQGVLRCCRSCGARPVVRAGRCESCSSRIATQMETANA